MTDVVGSEQTDQRGREGGSVSSDKSRSLAGDAWHDLIRNPIFVVSAIVVMITILMAIFPWLFAGDNPRPRGEGLLLADAEEGPSDGHLLGHTTQGYPMYTQLVWGTRNSLSVALISVVGTTILGTVFGVVAGYFGGITDTIISRLTDMFFGLPFILGAVVFLQAFGSRDAWSISAVLIILGWAQLTRIMRGSTLEIKARDYVEASRAVGAGSFHIIRKHILPNASGPVFVLSTISVGAYVSAEATLSFLGVGFEPPTVSWGLLIDTGQDAAIFEGAWHLLVFPCSFLIVTVLAFILLGDALRDALDPRGR